MRVEVSKFAVPLFWGVETSVEPPALPKHPSRVGHTWRAWPGARWGAGFHLGENHFFWIPWKWLVCRFCPETKKMDRVTQGGRSPLQLVTPFASQKRRVLSAAGPPRPHAAVSAWCPRCARPTATPATAPPPAHSLPGPRRALGKCARQPKAPDCPSPQ